MRLIQSFPHPSTQSKLELISKPHEPSAIEIGFVDIRGLSVLFIFIIQKTNYVYVYYYVSASVLVWACSELLYVQIRVTSQ